MAKKDEMTLAEIRKKLNESRARSQDRVRRQLSTEIGRARGSVYSGEPMRKGSQTAAQRMRELLKRLKEEEKKGK